MEEKEVPIKSYLGVYKSYQNVVGMHLFLSVLPLVFSRALSFCFTFGIFSRRMLIFKKHLKFDRNQYFKNNYVYLFEFPVYHIHHIFWGLKLFI